MKAYILAIFMLFFMGACKTEVKVDEKVVATIDIPEAPPQPVEKNDPKGVEPIPKEVLTTPDGEASMQDDQSGAKPILSPVPNTPTVTPTTLPAAKPPLKAGTIVKLKAGEFEILGKASDIPSGHNGYKTYTTTIDGVKYRIIVKGAVPKTGDYQEDPSEFAVSKYPMGVKAAVLSGKLTKEQIASIQMEEILKLFDYKDTDGGVNRHKEMAYLLQRYIVDGYLRGVNLIPIIKAQSSRLVIGVENMPDYKVEPNGAANGERVRFGNDFWEKRNTPFYSKLRTFYHELGHALLERTHKCGLSLMHAPKCTGESRPFPRGTKYDPLMDEMFNPKNWHDWTPGRTLEGKATPYCPINATKAEIAKGTCPKTR